MSQIRNFQIYNIPSIYISIFYMAIFSLSYKKGYQNHIHEEKMQTWNVNREAKKGRSLYL